VQPCIPFSLRTLDYGDELIAPLHYVNNSGCLPFVVNQTWTGSIFLLERGSCHFAQKVHNAEIAGAAAALVIDDQPLCFDRNDACDEALCTEFCPLLGYIPPAQNPDGCVCFLPFLADDNNFEVSIPSFIISHSAGRFLVDCLAGEGCVRASASASASCPCTFCGHQAHPRTCSQGLHS
jgi:hypothetical protein